MRRVIPDEGSRRLDPRRIGEPQVADGGACAAALSTIGVGFDKPPLNERTRSRWRRQALGWLKAGLAYWTKQAQSGSPDDKAQVTKTLRHWKADPDLVGIRDEESLKSLGEDDHAACRALCAEVDQLLKPGATK